MLVLDLYVYTYLDGLFESDDADDPTSVKRRYMMRLKLRDFPIYWSSYGQIDILLYIFEAKYIVLSQGMRELVTA